MKRTVTRILEGTPGLGRWLERRRQRQRQRDWTTVTRARFETSELVFYTTIGLGDVMIARQFVEAFTEYCSRSGDPKIGRLAITAGAWLAEFEIEPADHHLYWWWSMNNRADWLEVHLAAVRAAGRGPDVIGCLSPQCEAEAARLGCAALSLPLGVGTHFICTNQSRSGVGFAGSRNHKDAEQVAAVIGPFQGQPDFEWVDHLTRPQDLAEFYNRKRIVLGMTERFQESVGMVNNRVFEVLATDTPFILHEHRAVEQVLGFAFPYQTRSAQQTRQLADDILADYPRHQVVFSEFGRMVRERHSYLERVGRIVQWIRQNRTQ